MFTAPVTVIKPFANYHEFWKWIDECRWSMPKGAAFVGKNDLFWPYDEHGLDGVAHRATVGIGAAEGLIAEAEANGKADLVAHYGKYLAGWRHIYKCTIEKMGEAH